MDNYASELAALVVLALFVTMILSWASYFG